MATLQKVGGGEKIGFGVVASDKSKHKAGRRTYVGDQLWGHAKNRDRISMDRLSRASAGRRFSEVVDAAKNRAPKERPFRGWQTFLVAGLHSNHFSVQPTVAADNPKYPYHADVIIPVTLCDDRAKKEKAIRKMIDPKCWCPYPAT